MAGHRWTVTENVFDNPVLEHWVEIPSGAVDWA